jgi:hypothetical protein
LATAVVLFVSLISLRTPSAPVIQLAILNTAGVTRGTDADEVATLQEMWKGSPVQNFSSASELEAWEKKPVAGQRTGRGKNHLRSGSRRGQSIWALPREGLPKNFSFGERSRDDPTAGKCVRSGTNEKVTV